MNNIQHGIILIVLMINFTAYSQAQTLIIGVDSSNWYPNSYIEENRVAGRDVDLAARAMTELGHSAEFQHYPWKRCLSNLEKGAIQALVSVSYSKSRSSYALYPPGSESDSGSEYRLSRVEYVLVGSVNNSFRFSGDMSGINEKVSVPLGYSIGKDLESAGVSIKYFSDIFQCFKYVLSFNQCLTVSTRENASAVMRGLNSENELVIHTIPVKEKSYYLVFSRKNPGVSLSSIEAVWEKIRSLRDDPEFYGSLLQKYPTVQVKDHAVMSHDRKP